MRNLRGNKGLGTFIFFSLYILSIQTFGLPKFDQNDRPGLKAGEIYV